MSKNIFTFNKEKNDKTNSIFMENIENKYKEKTSQLIKSLVFTIPFTVSILNSQMFNEINDLNLLRYQLNIQDITKNSSNDLQKVFQVNNYVNSYKYKSDIDNYGEKEYYASPLEMIKKEAGDCEDYAILKYNILVNEFGLDKNNFKFVFGTIGKNNEPHILLSYNDNGKEYYLDNTIKDRILESQNHKSFNKILDIKDNKIIFNNGEEKKISSNHKYNKLLDLSLPIKFSEKLITYEKDKDLAMLDFER